MIQKTTVTPAKTCYDHLGGKLGAMLLEIYIHQGWIQKLNPNDKHFFITDKGKVEFAKLGLDLSKIKPEEI